MTERQIKIAMHGVTGRMGGTQHLERSIAAIRQDGGVELSNNERLIPEPILVGRSEQKLASLARQHNIASWTTDLRSVLCDPEVDIFFDAGSTLMRPSLLADAINAGKNVYCEKPVAANEGDVKSLYELASSRGVKHGVVQDKLWLPGIATLHELIADGYFGEILSVKIDFGYWVFAGDTEPAQRPSWNYRSEDGGGIILDMMPHWHYVIENLFGSPQSIFCHGATHVKKRWDEEAVAYAATADDAFYALVELKGGAVVQIASSWCTRVRRDDLVTIQVDGTEGSAVAGLMDVRVQSLRQTPRAVWNPDEPNQKDFYSDWTIAPPVADRKNAFRRQWELFLKHVVEDAPFPWDFASGARGSHLLRRP